MSEGYLKIFEAMRILIPLAFIAGCFYYIFNILKKIRYIIDTPTAKIRSAAQGYVELQGIGELMPGPAIHAPGSGLKCLWYEYTVEELEHSHDQYRWVKTLHQRSDECFYLRDQTGVCVVDPHQAQVIPSRQSQWYGRKQTGLWGRRRVRYTETLIDLASPILVIGEFNTIRASDETLVNEDALGHLIREWKKNYDELIDKFDLNQDGKLDKREWEVVLLAAEREVRQTREQTLHETGIHVIAHPKHKGRPFIIAGKSQNEILKTFWYRIIGIAMVLIGSIFIIYKIGPSIF